MSNKGSHAPEAKSSEEAYDPELQNAVAGLMRLSTDELDDLNTYSVSLCNEKIRELIAYINNPTGETRTIPQVLGQLTLLHDRKAELQAAEHSERLEALQTSYQAEQLANSLLKDEFKRTTLCLTKAQEDKEDLRQDCQELQLRLHAAKCGAGTTIREAQSHKTSGADLLDSDSEPETDPGPKDTGKQKPTEPSMDELRAELVISQAREAGLRKELDNARQTTLTDRRIDNREPAFPETASGYTILDQYPPSVTYDRSIEAPYPQGASQSVRQGFFTPSEGRRTSTSIRPRHHPQLLSEDRDFEPLLGDEPYAWRGPRPHLEFTPQVRHASRKGETRSSYPETRYQQTSEDSDDAGPHREQGMRTRQLESLARDIERFDPGNRESTIEDYLREVERCLLDLPHASAREKLRLIWKTTSRSVHVFMETLPPAIRDRYLALCRALREEYSQFTDQASATLGAFAIMQKKLEPPKEYYRRLRAAYFQGRNAPGLEEDQAFKSLFLHNLHESIRYDVTMHCRASNLTMQGIRRYAQLAWETRVRPGRTPDHGARVLEIQAPKHAELTLEGHEKPRINTHARSNPQPRQPFRQQGGRQNQRNDGPNRFQNQGKPRQPDSFQTNRKVRFEQNHKQGGRFGDRTPNSFKNENYQQQSMEDFIRKCVTETMRGRDRSSHLPTQPESPKKPDAQQPSA